MDNQFYSKACVVRQLDLYHEAEGEYRGGKIYRNVNIKIIGTIAVISDSNNDKTFLAMFSLDRFFIEHEK